jgi:Arc/MetJ-type ribon-helix-helix transcriptional regulator
MAVKYADFKISRDLAGKIHEIVDSGTLGYRSANEFVNDAVRRRVEEILRMTEKPKR